MEMSGEVLRQDMKGTEKLKKPEISDKSSSSHRAALANELWTDGLICAFELKRTCARKSRSASDLMHLKKRGVHARDHMGSESANSAAVSSSVEKRRLRATEDSDISDFHSFTSHNKADDLKERTFSRGSVWDHKWVPIGWARISELIQQVQFDDSWEVEDSDYTESEYEYTVADVAAPFWVRPAGPNWWCHLMAGHPSVDAWLNNCHWLHPAIRTALRDESKLISDRMKHLFYEVPVRVSGGLLFELLGQSIGDPFHKEDDIPIVLRSWQSQNFLVTVMHVKSEYAVPNLNVLGITEVQEMLLAGGIHEPRSVHEIIVHLASRLARWDDRLFRKYIFGEADEIELKYVNRRNRDDLNLLSVIFNEEIKRLATQIIRVKWSLHAREEIVFELLKHLKGSVARSILEDIRKSTREMLEEQEAVRERLFTIQDVMQSAVRAWLQDKSLRVTHNLTIFGGCGLVLTILVGLFGINVDGIPGHDDTPYAFGVFSAILVALGVILVAVGFLFYGFGRPITEEQVELRKLELEEMVSTFQHDAESHAMVRDGVNQSNALP